MPAYVAQNGLEFVIVLPPPPEGWDSRYALPHLANISLAISVLINPRSSAMPPSSYPGPMIFFLYFLFIETRAHVVQAGFLSQPTTSAEIIGISQHSKLILIYLIFKLALLICMYWKKYSVQYI